MEEFEDAREVTPEPGGLAVEILKACLSAHHHVGQTLGNQGSVQAYLAHLTKAADAIAEAKRLISKLADETSHGDWMQEPEQRDDQIINRPRSGPSVRPPRSFRCPYCDDFVEVKVQRNGGGGFGGDVF